MVIRSVRLQINRCFSNEILVLGDSHAEIFETGRIPFPTGYFLNVVSVPGATVSGLKTRAQKHKLALFSTKNSRRLGQKKLSPCLER